jgi:hypothetical protein
MHISKLYYHYETYIRLKDQPYQLDERDKNHQASEKQT